MRCYVTDQSIATPPTHNENVNEVVMARILDHCYIFSTTLLNFNYNFKSILSKYLYL